MPTIQGIPGPYRFYFYSFDCNEPQHVHVKRDKMICKFWLEPVELARNNGFSARELNRIRAMIREELTQIATSRTQICFNRVDLSKIPVEQRDQALLKQWQMRLERADYQAQLAERRYQEVDPSNRLVAGTLERRWNELLDRGPARCGFPHHR